MSLCCVYHLLCRENSPIRAFAWHPHVAKFVIAWQVILLGSCVVHNYRNCNKILKFDWLSPVLMSALIGQCNRTVRANACVRKNGLFSLLAKNSGISWVLIRKRTKI